MMSPAEILEAEGKTVVFVLFDGKLQGAIALANISGQKRSKPSMPLKR